MEEAVLQQWQESLDRPSQDQASYRLTKKTTKNVAKSALDMMSWRNAWDEYVRGNVVSVAAAKVVQRFLLNTMASSGKAVDDAQSEADASEDECELPPLKLPCQKFQELLQSTEEVDSLGSLLRKPGRELRRAARRRRAPDSTSTNKAIASEREYGKQILRA